MKLVRGHLTSLLALLKCVAHLYSSLSRQGVSIPPAAPSLFLWQLVKKFEIIKLAGDESSATV